MSESILGTQPELRLPPEFAFMGPDAITEFRDAQNNVLYEAGREAVQSSQPFEALPLYQAARAQVYDQNPEACAAYVAQHYDRDANPELFNSLTELVIKTSIHRMDSAQWHLGEPDEAGNYTKPETSGRALLERELTSLLAPGLAPGVPDMNGDNVELIQTPEVISAREQLDSLRQELASLSIQRRRDLHNKGRKRAQQETRFNELNERYRVAHTAYAALGIAQLRERGRAEEKLQTDAIREVITEHGRFTTAEKTVLEQDQSASAKFARFIAKTNRRFFAATFLTGGVVGFGARSLLRKSASVAGFALGAGLGAGVGIGIAAGTTRAALTSLIGIRVSQISEHGKRAAEDTDFLRQSLEGHNPQEFSHSQLLRDIIANRVITDRRNNRRRLAKAALVGAFGGAVGAVAADGILHLVGNAHTQVAPSHSHPAHHHNHTSAPKHTHHHKPKHPGVVDGFHTNVRVESGHGYTQELQQLAAQKHIHLSGADSYRLYEHLAGKFHGHLFTNDPSYVISHGDYGISHAGPAHWDPRVIHELHRWLAKNHKTGA